MTNLEEFLKTGELSELDLTLFAEKINAVKLPGDVFAPLLVDLATGRITKKQFAERKFKAKMYQMAVNARGELDDLVFDEDALERLEGEGGPCAA